MKHKQLSWKKGAFSCVYQISNLRKTIGSLKVSSYSSGALGQINGGRYAFKKQGLLSRTIHVIQKESQSLVASIKVNIWGNKVSVQTKEKNYIWRFRNVWQTKWTLADEKQVLVSGTRNGLNMKGNIAHKEIDEVLILISLYVKNYMIRMNSGY